MWAQACMILTRKEAKSKTEEEEEDEEEAADKDNVENIFEATFHAKLSPSH